MRTNTDEPATRPNDLLSSAAPEAGGFGIAEPPAAVSDRHNGGVLPRNQSDLASADRLVSLGDAHVAAGRQDDAAGCYDAALLLNPQNANGLANLGRVLHQQRKLEEAAACFHRALELEPDNPWFHSYLGALLLLKGEFEQGWREFEWVWQTKEVQADTPNPGKPRWDGSPLEGRLCLLQAPFGFGDNLQWSRFASHMAARGARVILECQPELVRLMRTLSGVAQVVAAGEPLPAFDVYAPLISLPHLLGLPSPRPADVPYLRADKADAERWAQALPPSSDLRVGLVWAADPTHPGAWRSVPLATLAPLANVGGVTFFSLQKGAGVEQLGTAPPGMRVVDLGQQFTDFADAAGLLMQMDVVITVDTAMAHLAGALGRPVWILLASLPDARWLLDRNDSPWYPSARLFRQKRAGDWAPVIARVASELAKLTALRQRRPTSGAPADADRAGAPDPNSGRRRRHTLPGS